MFRGCKSVVLVAAVACCWGASLSAISDPSTGGLGKEARAAVGDYLLSRGEFPDGLSVSHGIEVSFKSQPSEHQVGRLFSLTAQITNSVGSALQGKDVELLLLDDRQQVIPALMQWEGDNQDVSGVWKGSQVLFKALFLTHDLPQGSQLCVVVRDEKGSNKFRVQAFPLSSRAAKYQLADTAYEVVDNQPRSKWTLSFTTDVPAKTLYTYYVRDEYGSRSEAITYSVPSRPASPSLTIIGQPHRLWGDGCFTLVVELFKPRWENGVMIIDPDIVTTQFGNCR